MWKLTKLPCTYWSQLLTLGRPLKNHIGISSLKFLSSMNSQRPDNFDNRLIWVDLEMTGLDPDKHKIMEAACIVTDDSLNVVATSPNLIIHVNDEDLNGMDAWCTKTHKESGLTDACKRSKITIEEADEILWNFVKQHTPAGKCPLAGNSIAFDRFFMIKFLSKFNEHIHYRHIDVSTIKELSRRWNAVVQSKVPKKILKHRATEDILESIDELRYYKKTFFKVLP